MKLTKQQIAEKFNCDVEKLQIVDVTGEYEIEVWYRYVTNGEQEKETETHTIEADSVQEAVNIADSLYKSKSAIPFKFYYEGLEYKPNGLTKNELFNLTNPN
jgi:hypothetical protein